MNNYVKVPENLIVIDFDLKDDNKQKSLLMNLEAASKWSPTYAELGAGAHLHLIARSKIKDGDVAM